MEKHFLPFLIFVSFLTACSRHQKDDTGDALYQKFHGKYKMLRSVASDAVDINLDVVASINLFEELPDMQYCNLEIRIRKPSVKGGFIENWPEAYFSGFTNGGLAAYDPDVAVIYATQGVLGICMFDEGLQIINLLPDSPETYQQRFIRPNSVHIKSGNLIEITKTKNFYTKVGWKTIKVTTLYQRYAMDT